MFIVSNSFNFKKKNFQVQFWLLFVCLKFENCLSASDCFLEFSIKTYILYICTENVYNFLLNKVFGENENVLRTQI